MAELHNLTLYVAPDEFESVRAFYSERLGLAVVFEEAGHICCLRASDDVAICIHEAEPGHAAGSRELFFWVDDGDSSLTDPTGNLIRLHVQRPGGR